MAKITKVNHVAIVVRDIEESLKFWEESLGLSLDHIEVVPSQHSRVAFIPVGDSEVELVQPTSSETGLAAYLEKKVKACTTSAWKWTISTRNWQN